MLFDNSAVMLRNIMQKYTSVCVVFSGYILFFTVVMNQPAYKSNSRNDLEKDSNFFKGDRFYLQLEVTKIFLLAVASLSHGFSLHFSLICVLLLSYLFLFT